MTLQVATESGTIQLDTSDEKCGNWTHFLRKASREGQENLIATQVNNNVTCVSRKCHKTSIHNVKSCSAHAHIAQAAL